MRYLALIPAIWLGGCASLDRCGNESYFDRVWRQDALNREVQSREDYLEWVASFYAGSPFIPGWTRRQAELAASVDPAEARIAEPQLECLGRLLSSEWAKDNRIRLVGSDLIVLWASVLSEARDEGRLVDALDALLADVRSLLAGALDAGEITPDRYEKLTMRGKGRPDAVERAAGAHTKISSD